MHEIKNNTVEWWIRCIKDPTIRDEIMTDAKYKEYKNLELSKSDNLGTALTYALSSSNPRKEELRNAGYGIGNETIELLTQPYIGDLQANGVQSSYKENDWVYLLEEREQTAKIGEVYQVGGNYPDDIWLKGVKGYPNYYLQKDAIRPATPEEISKATVRSNDWQVGEVLPNRWLDTVEVRRADGSLYTCALWNGNRTVEKVNKGKAVISDSIGLWLKPKSNYPTYPEQPSTIQWKEGDWVEVLDTAIVKGYNSRDIGYIWQLDEEAAKDLNAGTICIEKANKYATNFYPTDLKKVDGPHPTTSTFKAGDRIKRTVCPGGSISVGDEGIVTAVETDKMLSVSWDNGNAERCNANYAEKLPPKAPDMESEYKVGQRVIVHSGANIKGFDGSRGKILAVDKHASKQPHIHVEFESGARIHCYPETNTSFNVEILPYEIPGNNIPVTVEKVTATNVYVGMRVCRTPEFCKKNYMDAADTKIGGSVRNTDPIQIDWDNGSGNNTKYKDGHLYIHNEQVKSESNQVNNQKLKTQTNEHSKEECSNQDSYQYTGTAINLCADQEGISTGQSRAGYSLRCDGQPELTTSKYCTNTKGYGYCEEV